MTTSTPRSKVDIAFRRKVRAVWLDQGLALAAQNVPWDEAKLAIAPVIAIENPGAETIRKVLEHVRRIWFEPPADCQALRSAALNLFREQGSTDTRFLLNWGMSGAAYPFVGSVAEALGRLLKLQHEACRADIQRRLREQYGDRDFVNRITRYNISSLLDWGAVAESKPLGVYVANKKVQPSCSVQMAWIIEAVLISRQQTQMAFSQLRNHPCLFPVSLQEFNSSTMRANPRLRVERQSLNEECVLRNYSP